MKVYEGNWSGKDRPNMIQCIKQRQKEIDHDIVTRMFENLKGRIHLAKKVEMDYQVLLNSKLYYVIYF